MENDSDSFDLLKVIKGDYCIGCGVCAAVDNSPIQIKENNDGQYQAYVNAEYVDDEMRYRLDTVCPFSNKSDNENAISKKYFHNLKGYNKKIGYYDKLFAGYVNEGNFRNIGSSGGFGSWLSVELLKNNLVDEIIHVKGDDEKKFQYSVSSNVDEVKSGAKSRYYPIEMSEILEYVKGQEKKFAIVGIPCFIKSIRLLSKNNDKIQSRIKFTIGLVCGHLKSSFYSDMLARKMGVDPSKSYKINFREKIKGQKASDYGTKITVGINHQRREHIKATKEIYGTKWGYGFFKYNACDYCDDVLAETADITIGDAWLPEYNEDYMGTNIIISRNSTFSRLIEQAIEEKRVKVDKLSEERIIASQAGGFRHRHYGLSYRLYLKDRQDEWRPQKRHTASKSHLSIPRRLVYKLRMLITEKSFKYYKREGKKNDLKSFDSKMKLLTGLHDFMSKLTWAKLQRKIKSFFNN